VYVGGGGGRGGRRNEEGGRKEKGEVSEARERDIGAREWDRGKGKGLGERDCSAPWTLCPRGRPSQRAS
jgi:hypothetical protein